MLQTIGMRIVGTLALAALSGCSGREPTEAADIKAMMNLHVQPEAEHYWQAVQYISDEQGSREIVPRNEAEWNRTIEAARKLKELGESLTQPSYAEGKGADWQDFAKGLVDASEQAVIAAQSRKPEQVLEAGGTLYNVCSACHEIYMPSPGGLAPTGQTSPGSED